MVQADERTREGGRSVPLSGEAGAVGTFNLPTADEVLPALPWGRSRSRNLYYLASPDAVTTPQVVHCHQGPYRGVVALRNS